MNTITVEEIQLDPAAFVQLIEAFVVLRDDRPVAEVEPVSASPRERRPYGLRAGQFVVSKDFDDPLPEDILDVSECIM